MGFINQQQFRTVLIFQALVLGIMGTVGYGFWVSICGSTLESCINPDSVLSPLAFLAISVLRPFFFTPVMVVAMIAGSTWGPVTGTLLTALGASLSCLLIYWPGKILGVNWVRPWLTANLPATWQLLRTQDYKIAFITRWIPLFPFDIFSLLFGVANFKTKRTFIATFFGILPEAFVFNSIGSARDSEILGATIINLLIFGCLTTIPLLVFEFFFRKRGSSLWMQIKRTYYEIVYEVRANNEVIRRHNYDNSRTPVILLYGFFSSRRALTIMERLLTQRGFQVMSFNLGGLLGVFFTRGIKETAHYIDLKIERQIERHGFKKVQVVAHSKGGLVALWWALRLGGHRYCDKIITMGTPFKGTWLSFLALFTPLGFIWRDVWQMRPGSRFLKDLQASEIPPDLTVYCCYSQKDKIATGENGIFQTVKSEGKGQIIPVPMHNIAHFEFLYRKDVGNSLARLLRASRPIRPGESGINSPPLKKDLVETRGES